jgi:hypothetical protein
MMTVLSESLGSCNQIGSEIAQGGGICGHLYFFDQQARPLGQFKQDAMSCLERQISTAAMMLGLLGAGCTEMLDAGSNHPHGILPVDERNPVLLTNDGSDDNWQGEYAMLLASTGGLKLAGIVIGTSPPWPDIQTNIDGWRQLVTAARASGLANIPDPITSIGAPLVRPDSGVIEDTTPNRSEGARSIIDTSARLSLPYRPVAVLTGGRLTDIADAYLIDRTVADRIVVVSSLGTTSSTGGAMGIPNGEMDPWAETIVAARFKYVQVSAFYDQLTDVPAARLSELPDNPLGSWIAAKQPKIWNTPVAADQVTVAALGLPSFAVQIERVSSAGSVAAGASAGPDLVMDPNGPAWLVTQITGAVATTRFWDLLEDPTTFTR